MKPTSKGLRDLFRQTKPYRSEYLKVSKLHTIHFEECGNPLVFLHGGPGGGIEPFYHRYFDPKKWRIVLHDQDDRTDERPFG
jgi:proline iminopeptidase